jgi:hypothetical protein
MHENLDTRNLDEYLLNKLEGLPSATRRVIVLDPSGMLNLGEGLSFNLKSWTVIRYDGNDLAFRRELNPEKPYIIWIKGVKNSFTKIEIDLTTLTDIIQKADAIFDVSIVGVLQALIPGETWPEEALDQFEKNISSNLKTFKDAYYAVKPHLGTGSTLNIYSIQAIILASSHPELPVQDFLFRVDTPVRLLRSYIKLVWSSDWKVEELELLRAQAQEASYLQLGDLEAWFTIPSKSLSRLIYLYRFLSKARVPNIMNQLRGLGLLDFDPEPLEPGLSQVIPLWDRDQVWRDQIILDAEDDLDFDILRHVIGLMDLSSVDQFGEMLRIADTPGWCYVLLANMIELAYQKKEMTKIWKVWVDQPPLILTGLSKYSSLFAKGCMALKTILDQLIFIQERLLQEITPDPGLSDILKWYTTGEFYSLEFTHSQAFMALALLKEKNINQLLGKILVAFREEIRKYLDNADHELARRIQASWHSYSNASQLSIRFLRDFIERNHYIASPQACLWFIIFDGMRYDTWEHIIKPSLLERFEIKKEQPYLSLLPTWTGIARTGLIAGRLPDAWSGYKNTYTANQAILACKLFGVQENQRDQKIRFFSGMESDRTSVQLDVSKRYPYNVLIYNISDDDLHKQRDHIGALNENVRSAIGRIIESLDLLIGPEDTVIISSDHGFMELDPGYSILVKDDNRWERYMEGAEHPVHYRFIRAEEPANLPQNEILSFEWKIPNGKFTVAVGRKWFQRQESQNTVRYDHGGLSFAEMVVPGVVMKLIQEKKFDLVFEDLPKGELIIEEGQEKAVVICIRNRGNQPGNFELSYGLDTDLSLQAINPSIAPSGNYKFTALCRPVIQKGGKVTKSLLLRLHFNTIEGQAKSIHIEIPIRVNERKDMVQISLGDLDNLDL